MVSDKDTVYNCHMRFSKLLFSLFLLIVVQLPFISKIKAFDPTQIHIGADRPEVYLPLLLNKNIAVVANPTSIVGNRRQHLVDFLIQNGVKVKVVFAPEHGFRGDAGAGEEIRDGLDASTGIKVISLYGKKTKPTADDLKNIQVLVFDIQDVGVRFYTYLSTLQLVMEACANAGVKVILFDRPNPNGYYVDGPVLKNEFKSFVGMNPIPVVHGCTPGEYARMLIGEGWLNSKKKCDLTVIPISNYSHSIGYNLPVRPSPNLPDQNAIYLYPSLCFFEGTVVSLGRGTDFPFETYGYPDYKSEFVFRPVAKKGVVSHPPYQDTLCYGVDLRKYYATVDSASHFFLIHNTEQLPKQIELKWLIDAYLKCPDKEKFFNSFFEKLAGSKLLQLQLKSGLSETAIRLSWKKDLRQYLKVRSKYLLYPDFKH